MLTYAALQLRIFYFFERSKSDLRRGGLLRAFATSMAVISMLDRAKENYNVMHYAPSHFGRIIIVASVVILKVLHSSYSQFVDFEAGKRAFNLTLSLLRNASIENNDLHGRSSKILAQLWSFHGSLTPKNQEDPNLKLKTRSSASVLHDALWVWRERFEKEAASYIALSGMQYAGHRRHLKVIMLIPRGRIHAARRPESCQCSYPPTNPTRRKGS
jgi:hypothetical protein